MWENATVVEFQVHLDITKAMSNWRKKSAVIDLMAYNEGRNSKARVNHCDKTLWEITCPKLKNRNSYHFFSVHVSVAQEIPALYCVKSDQDSDNGRFDISYKNCK